MPKRPIDRADVTNLGIVGDVQRNRKYHGGPQKALLLIASEVIDRLAAEGWPVFYGALGENITTVNVDHRSWRPGLCYRIGAVLVELTTPRQPCATLNSYGPGIQKRLYDKQAHKARLRAATQQRNSPVLLAGRVTPGLLCASSEVKLLDPDSLHWGESGFYAAVLEPGSIMANDIMKRKE